MTTSNGYAQMETCAVNFSVRRNHRVAAYRGSNQTCRQFAAIFLLVSVCVALLASCGSKGPTLVLQVNPNTTQMVDEGQPLLFTATLSNNDTKGVNWTFTGTGCAGNGCGILSNVTTTSVTYTAPTGRTSQLNVSLVATSIADPRVVVTVAITVVLPPTFTTLTVPNGANGVPYNQTIVVTGGVTPLTFSIPAANGTLPSGLSINNTGTISGRPSGPGNQTNPELFTVVVTDNGSTPLSVTSPQYSIAISPAPILSVTSVGNLPPATLNDFYSTHINTVGGVQPFSWSVAANTLPPGLSLDPVSGVISGTPTVASPTAFPFTPQVQDSSIPVQTRTSAGPLKITVSAPPPLAITTVNLPSGLTVQPYSAFLAATGGVPPYTWTIASGQLPSGLTLNPSSGQITGTPVLVNTSIFTVQVQDSESTPVQTLAKPFSISIGPGNANANALLSGSYAFLFTGFDSDGVVTTAGAFTANGNGVITTGLEDVNRKSLITLNATLTGTYAMNTDGTGTMELVASNILKQIVVSDYQIVLDSEGNLRFFENDINNLTPPMKPIHGAGIIKLQSVGNFSTADFGGNYTFGFAGQDFSAKPVALAGVVHADGSLSLTPGMVDFNDAGTFNSQLPLSGFFSVTSPIGRGTANMVFAALGEPQMVLQYAFYFVSQRDLFFIEVDTTDSTHPRIAGEMMLQNPSTSFSATTLSGGSIVSGNGLDGTNPSAFIGRILAPDPACGMGVTVSLTTDQNDGGTITGPMSSCGTYNIIPNGRAGFTNLGTRLAAAYLSDQNQGFLIGSDAAATLGLLEAQSGGPVFSRATIQGGYTLSAPVIAAASVSNLLGQLSCLNADGNLNGTILEIDSNGTPHTAVGASPTFTVTDATKGRGIVVNNSAELPANLAFYIVSRSKIRMISTDAGDKNPQVIFLDH